MNFDLSKSAVIDIGSNSVRLMMPAKNSQLNHKELITTVLAEDLALTGILKTQAIIRTAKAVLDFYAKALDYGFQRIAVFATAAVREAANGAEFVEIVRQGGADIQILSGETEAKCGYLGAAISFQNKPCAVFDIGGGSIELAYGKNNSVIGAKSLPLGVHILRQSFGYDRQKIEKHVSNSVRTFDILPYEHLIGISGTATSIAAMKLGLEQYDPKKVHLASVSGQEVDTLTDKIFTLSSPKNIQSAFPSLSINRASVIHFGLIVTKSIMRHLKAEYFTASETDNTEGFSLLFC